MTTPADPLDGPEPESRRPRIIPVEPVPRDGFVEWDRLARVETRHVVRLTATGRACWVALDVAARTLWEAQTSSHQRSTVSWPQLPESRRRWWRTQADRAVTAYREHLTLVERELDTLALGEESRERE